MVILLKRKIRKRSLKETEKDMRKVHFQINKKSIRDEDIMKNKKATRNG